MFFHCDQVKDELAALDCSQNHSLIRVSSFSLNVMGWDLSRVTFAKNDAQIRCVTDYEIPILAASLALAPSQLLILAIEKVPKRKKGLGSYSCPPRCSTFSSAFDSVGQNGK